MNQKKVILILFIITSLLFIFVTCNDDIFYTISLETPILEPMIKGSPTNFVLFPNAVDNADTKMYVASGRTLYNYKDNKWEKETLDKHIIQIAATENYLYALCFKDTDKAVVREVKRRSVTEPWAEVVIDADNYDFHTIYAAGQTIYIGAQKSKTNEFAVISITESGVSNIVYENENALLVGAAYNGSTYLCTRRGILIDGTMNSVLNQTFVGIINLPDNSIVAMSRSGNLYEVTTEIVTPAKTSFGDTRQATSAIAVWEDKLDTSKKLLLIGRGDLGYSPTSGFTHGYVELMLNETGGLILNANNLSYPFREPGPYDKDRDKDFPTQVVHSTVDNFRRYASSLGINPLNHLFQASDGIIFASTQRNGVWSYRDRNGTPQWNAETEPIR